MSTETDCTLEFKEKGLKNGEEVLVPREELDESGENAKTQHETGDGGRRGELRLTEGKQV